MKVFEKTDFGLMPYFLGMEIKQNEDNVFIYQKKYAQDILKKFHMKHCKVMSTLYSNEPKGIFFRKNTKLKWWIRHIIEILLAS